MNSDEISALPNSIKNLRIFADFPEVIENLSDIEFSCAEQFMMTGKAYLFNDHTIAAKIVQEPNPKNHKSLGRKIKNFDQIVWDKYSGDIVTLGSYLKFSQNPTLKNLLLETQNAELIEGRPLDKIWGVGLRFDDPKIANKKYWKGENRLGKCLMKARDTLME